MAKKAARKQKKLQILRQNKAEQERALDMDLTLANDKMDKEGMSEDEEGISLPEESQIQTRSMTTGKHCPHGKSVNMTMLKKRLPKKDLTVCETCREEEDESTSPSTPFHICLACARIECSDPSKHHQQKHHEIFGSQHAISMGIDLTTIWCFECERAPDPHKMAKLTECKAMVTKALTPTPQSIPDTKGKAEGKGGTSVNHAGLSNLGNTCFFNSSMQSLSASEVLPVMMQEWREKNEGSVGPLNAAFISLMEDMRESVTRVVQPKALFHAIAQRWRQFKGYQEQDAHELLRCLLDGLSEEARKAGCDPTESPHYIDRTFKGILTNAILCKGCGYVSEGTEPFLDISLPIELQLEQSQGEKVTRSSIKSKHQLKKERKGKKGPAPVPVIEVVEGTQGEVPEVQEPIKKDVVLQLPPEERAKYAQRAALLFPEQGGVAGRNGEVLTLEACLQNFVSTEELAGENQFACESCYRLMKTSGSDEEEEADEEDEDEKVKGGEEAVGDIVVDQKSGDSDEIDAEEGNDDDEEADEKDKDEEVKRDEEEVGEIVVDWESGDSDEVDEEEGENDEDAEEMDALGNVVVKTTAPSVIRSHEKPKYILRDARKRCIFKDAPPNIVFHLKRFRQVGLRGRMVKSDRVVAFSERLDMGPYVPAGGPSLVYRLYGVVDHRGGMSSGHYVAWVRSRREGGGGAGGPADDQGNWVHCSDAHVRPSTLEEVLSQSHAYILFYERV